MSDDVVYAILLLASVGAGPLVRYAKGPTQKQWFSTIAGIGLIAFACGAEAFHPLAVTFGNCLIIFLLGPRLAPLTGKVFIQFLLEICIFAISSVTCSSI